MLRTQDSTLHSNGNVLCGNLSGSAQRVNRSSSGYSPSPQHLKSGNVVERTSTAPTPMAPMRAPGRNARMFHPMDTMAFEYYPAPPSTYTSHPPQFAGYYPPADSGFAADVYEPFEPGFQPFDNPMDFGFFEPIPAQQPPMPPIPPEEPISPNSVFQYHPCRWQGGPPCDGYAPGRNREMGEHLRGYHRFVGHERDPVQCEWENCGQLMQRMNVPRHIVSRHLLAAASCRFCGKRFSRPDVVARHERTCTGILSVSNVPAARF